MVWRRILDTGKVISAVLEKHMGSPYIHTVVTGIENITITLPLYSLIPKLCSLRLMHHVTVL